MRRGFDCDHPEALHITRYLTNGKDMGVARRISKRELIIVERTQMHHRVTKAQHTGFFAQTRPGTRRPTGQSVGRFVADDNKHSMRMST